MTIKKARALRFLCRLAFTLVGYVAPIYIMLAMFEISVVIKTTRFTLIGLFIILLAIILLWKYKNNITTWINSWEYSIFKHILIGFSKVYIYIILVIFTAALKTFVVKQAAISITMLTTSLDTLLFCLIGVCTCQCIAYLIIYPLEQKCDFIVKRLLRKKERIEDIKEAIREDK